MAKGLITDDASHLVDRDLSSEALGAAAPAPPQFGALERVDALLAGALELAEVINAASAEQGRPLLEAIVEARLAALRLGEPSD